jgi:hypothetical protein
MLQVPQIDFENSSLRSKGLWIAITLALWLGTTWVFWVGYAGCDDLFYARYAFRFDRPPISWWEFRIPVILAIRASFLAFGPSEIAACLPNLLASLAILASVAWFVDWPRRLNWQTQASVILACVIPLEAGDRSDPGGASHLAASFLAVGTVCMLKGVGWTRYLGAPLLAIGFLTHEVSFFCVAVICLVALAFDWRRFWGPVLACVAVSGCAFLAECLTYRVLLGDPLARYRMAGYSLGSMTVGYDPDVGIGGWDFFAWPIKNLFFCKCFGFDLIALLVTGIVAWKRLSTEQRVLFASTFLIWLWLGYGTMVPWTYRPIYRVFPYYQPLTLGIAALLPRTLRCALARRERLAQGVVAVAILVHLACLAAGGRWGQAVDVSRELLAYAREHSDQTFLTDVATMNQMYVVGGFRLPANVVCLNGPAVDRHLLVNDLLGSGLAGLASISTAGFSAPQTSPAHSKTACFPGFPGMERYPLVIKEPPDRPRFHFPEVPIDNILLNLEQISGFHYFGLRSIPSKPWQEPDFSRYLEEHGAGHVRLAPVRYRLLFLPLIPLIGPKDFLVKNLGGEVVRVQRGCTGRTTPPPPPPPPSPGCCAAPLGASRVLSSASWGTSGPSLRRGWTSPRWRPGWWRTRRGWGRCCGGCRPIPTGARVNCGTISARLPRAAASPRRTSPVWSPRSGGTSARSTTTCGSS